MLTSEGGDDDLAPLILDKAEGNPFFLEELARAVAQQPHGQRDLGIPDTVHGVLTARIDRLADTPKRVLQTAAVLGREFTVRLLEKLWDGGALAPHLAELRRHEFLYERSGAEEPTYVFKHALTQEVAEATLVAARRRELNRRAADGLVALYPDRIAEMAPLLAHHYFEAGAWPLACEHAARAAESATAAYANREALVRYDQALAAAARAGLPDADRMRLHAARAHVHNLLGDFDGARTDLDAALALAEATGDVRARATFLGALGMLWGGHRDYPRGLDLTREAIVAAETSGDRRALADALRQSALMLLNLCRVRESDQHLQRALGIFEELGDARGVAETLDILTAVDGIRGSARSAVERGAEALRRYRALGDRTAEAVFSPTVGFWHVFAGDWPGGQALLESSITMATELGAPRDEAYARMALAWSCDLMGRYGRAARESQHALGIAREIGHLEWTVAALGILGGVHAHCGDAAGAQRLHEEMLRIARDLRAGLWLAASLSALGEDSLALGDLAGAARLLDEARTVAGEAMEFGLPAMLAQAELHLRQDEPTAALELAREAGAVSDYPVFAIESRRLEALAMAALGDPAAAEAGLRAAVSEADSLDAVAGAWRTRLALAGLLDRRGARTEAAAERATAWAALERTAEDLPSDLRASFMASALLQEARPRPG